MLNDIGFLSLYVGGADGGVIKNGSAAFTGECHLIEILEDATTFSILTLRSQADADVNALTANNYTAKEFNRGQFVFAPHGGYIKAFTASSDVRYFTMASTDRKRIEA